MTIFLLIFLVLLLAYTFLIEYYRRGWNRMPLIKIDEILASCKSECNKEDYTAINVSVIVAMRNEAHNIKRLAEDIRAQTYSPYKLEIIFVDDHSIDGSWQLISDAAAALSNLKAISLPEGLFGKKNALEYAIHQATGELILTTDADCSVPERWVETMVAFRQLHDAKFIAAPVKMTGRNTCTGIFQKIDFMTMQGITGASVFSRFHCMCNGANLAYDKSTFLDVGGFKGTEDIPSGDDMFLMYKIFKINPSGVFYLKSQEATVSTPPEPTWKHFFNQRIRWASKTVHFEDKKIYYVLLLTYLVNVSFVVLGVASLVNTRFIWIFVLLLLMKVVIEFPFVNAMCRFFKEPRLIYYFPFFQPFHIVYVVISGWLGRFGSYNWKSRVIKNKGRTKLAKQ